jgi:hypothetical protein
MIKKYTIWITAIIFLSSGSFSAYAEWVSTGTPQGYQPTKPYDPQKDVSVDKKDNQPVLSKEEQQKLVEVEKSFTGRLEQMDKGEVQFEAEKTSELTEKVLKMEMDFMAENNYKSYSRTMSTNQVSAASVNNAYGGFGTASSEPTTPYNDRTNYGYGNNDDHKVIPVDSNKDKEPKVIPADSKDPKDNKSDSPIPGPTSLRKLPPVFGGADRQSFWSQGPLSRYNEKEESETLLADEPMQSDVPANKIADSATVKVIETVRFGEDIKSIHALMNPPDYLHPFLKWLLYTSRVTKDMATHYYQTLEKRDQIYRLASLNKGKLAVRYKNRIFFDFPILAMPQLGGEYSLVSLKRDTPLNNEL